VILNQMSDDERKAFHADYIKQGPAGRPAPAAK
jgi:propane monooxygenase large subunit